MTVLSAIALAGCILVLTGVAYGIYCLWVTHDNAVAAITARPAIHTYCGYCGDEECSCADGLGDEVEAWLATGAHEGDRPYDWQVDGL